MKKAISLLLLCLVAATVFAQKSVPSEVRQWIDEELTKVKDKKLIDYNSNDFFRRENARLIGYIKGYDSSLGINTGLINTSNELTREDYPTVVNIFPDGRFEADIPMQYPIRSWMNLKGANFTFYLEPGQTLSMIIDWEEFPHADRWEDEQYKFKNIEFGGTLAQINNDLLSVSLKSYNWDGFGNDVKSLSPEQFKSKILELNRENQEIITSLKAANKLTPQSIKILEGDLMTKTGRILFEYVDKRKFMAQDDSDNQILKMPLPDEYYDFVQYLALDDQSLLIATDFFLFINRFEYCTPFFRVYNELGRPSSYEKEWVMKDSVYRDVLKLSPGIMYDITKTRQLKYKFEKSDSKESPQQILDIYTSMVSHPFLREEAKRIFTLAFPDNENLSYDLPTTKAAEIFKNIADKFKGKYILIDFWDTYCGPCIAGIKSSKKLREKYKDSEDIVFVFITNTSGSPLDRYNKLVEEQNMIHTYRLSDDDFNQMKELFKFNGIPHYETIDKEGKVMFKSLKYHSFEHLFSKRLEGNK